MSAPRTPTTPTTPTSPATPTTPTSPTTPTVPAAFESSRQEFLAFLTFARTETINGCTRATTYHRELSQFLRDLLVLRVPLTDFQSAHLQERHAYFRDTIANIRIHLSDSIRLVLECDRRKDELLAAREAMTFFQRLLVRRGSGPMVGVGGVSARIRERFMDTYRELAWFTQVMRVVDELYHHFQEELALKVMEANRGVVGRPVRPVRLRPGEESPPVPSTPLRMAPRIAGPRLVIDIDLLDRMRGSFDSGFVDRN